VLFRSRKVRRVGGLTSRPIDVRFVAATHRDLEADVVRGTFRQDLFFRLNGMTLEIPPLRERTEEIEALASLFLSQVCAQEGKNRQLTLSPEARRLLLRYRWPGNVRELRNVIERAALLVQGNVITRDDLPAERMEANAEASSGGLPIVEVPPSKPSRSQAPPALAPQTEPQEPVSASPPSWRQHGKSSAAERQAIVDALEQCAGNQTKAADLLGISRGTLVARLALYGLPRPRSSGGRSE